MASGIVFHNGHKKVELNLDVIEKAVNFTEEDEEMLAKKKSHASFLSNFIDDVTNFGDKITARTAESYKESIRPIVDYLIDEEEEKLNNIFDTSSSGLLKTAVVQCNFSDVSKVIGDVKEDLLVEVRGATVIKITELDELHLIIDRISESKGLCVLVIQQFEALNPSTLDHLTALIFSKSSLRKRISSLRLVVCICTSVIFLKSSCANETLNSLTLKQFTFTDPKQIFDQVMNINILPAVFSGNFLKYLRNRFFTCDYSVAALSRAVHYAFLSKYIDDPLWKQKSAENNERIEQYSKVIKIYAKMMKRTKLVIQFHYEIQTDKEFWDKATDEQYFRDWKRATFESKEDLSLHSLVEFLKSELAEIDEEWCAGLDYFYDRFRNESPQKDTSPEKAEPSTPGSAPKKMGMNSFLQMQRNMMKAKMENPQKAVKNDIFEHVMSFFKRILTPWPSDWPNVIDCDFSKLDSACEVDLEQTLLADKKFSRDPTSIAWRSLLEQNKWKSVSLGDWAKAFVEDFGAGQNAHGAFFAAISHLEHMGLVKANNDKKSTSVTVLYHPSVHANLL